MFYMQGPTYTFKLRNDGCEIDDDVGIALTDNTSAYRYALSVARELMHCREIQTRYWELEVYRGGEGPLFDILFATVDRRSTTSGTSCGRWWKRLAAKSGRSRT